MIIPPIHLPFLPSDIPHSQDLQIAQVVKDPGRELGEVVFVKVPIHPQPHDTWEEEEGRNE